MNTCNECEHQKVPKRFNESHPCIDCHGERIVLNGSNFRAKPLQADPDPCENTTAHAVVEVRVHD